MAINPLFLQEGSINPTGGVDLTKPTTSPEQKVEEEIPQAPDVGVVGGPVNVASTNPAITTLVNEVNRMLSEGQEVNQSTFTPELQDAINQINALETDKNLAVANARDAADNEDAGLLDQSMGEADKATSTQTELLSQLLEQQKIARESFISALAPTERETELKEQLNTLRTERQLLPLELRQEGISAAGIQGRQINDERVRAIQEQNLLLELGLEQEARQFAQASAEAQLGFIQSDIDLQFKIDDRLRQQELDILEQARNLGKDQINFLANIADEDALGGLAWEDLDVGTQAFLVDEAKRLDVPIEVVKDVLGNVKKQQVLDRSKGATDRFSTSQENRGAAAAGLPISEFSNLDVDTQNFFINNASEFEDKKEAIDTAITDGEGLDELTEEIEKSNALPAVKDMLKKYAATQFENRDIGLKDKIVDFFSDFIKGGRIDPSVQNE